MRSMFFQKDKLVKEMPGYSIFIDFGVAYYVVTERTDLEFTVSAVKGSVVYQHRSTSLYEASLEVIKEYKAKRSHV